MKYFWLLKPTEVGRKLITWDCYNGFVVKAANANEARKVAQDSITYPPALAKAGWDNEIHYSGDENRGGPFWINSQLSSCTRLRETGKSEVILASFNAG